MYSKTITLAKIVQVTYQLSFDHSNSKIPLVDVPCMQNSLNLDIANFAIKYKAPGLPLLQRRENKITRVQRYKKTF